MDLLKTPKKLYLKWIKGEYMTTEEITSTLYTATEKASELRLFYQMQKIELSWIDYKKLIEGFLKKILDNCKPIDLYEPEKTYNSIYDFMNEDNFYVRYFSKCLNTRSIKGADCAALSLKTPETGECTARPAPKGKWRRMPACENTGRGGKMSRNRNFRFSLILRRL